VRLICSFSRRRRKVAGDPELLHEVRWHGRAGQGVITSSRLLAQAALLEGKHVQAFPEFGPERLGAPISGFTRISDEVIDTRSQIYNPGFVVVLDPSLLATVNVTRGLLENGKVILNSPKRSSEMASKLSLDEGRVRTIDATHLAMEIAGRPIVNTAMLGALAKVAPLAALGSIEKALKDRFAGSLGEKNVELIRRVYEMVE
jgi:2-oxoacid:acceptor oxidoreductase gamma subunit (pyruvate/2-ketoisovalerate family)